MTKTNGEAVSLVIAAAGMGTRLNTGLPKGLSRFKNSNFLGSMLDKTSSIFQEIIVVCNESHFDLFKEYRERNNGNWKLCAQTGGSGTLYALLSGIKIVSNSKVIVCWVDQIGLDSQIFLETKKNISEDKIALAFPIVLKSNPYVQAIINSGKLEDWRFKRENDETASGFTDCGIFGINKKLLENFIQSCPRIEIYKSQVTKEINFLSILPDFQKNNLSKIWEEFNQLYTLAVNTPDELYQAEKLL